MIKLYGGFCIAGACGMTCLCLMYECRMRADETKAILAMLRWLRAELEICLTSIPELAYIAAEKCSGSAALLMAEFAKGCENIGDDEISCIWSASVMRTLERMDDESKAALCELGQALGRYDAQTQCEAISLCVEKISCVFKKESAKRTDGNRCAMEMVCAIGAMIIILLI